MGFPTTLSMNLVRQDGTQSNAFDIQLGRRGCSLAGVFYRLYQSTQGGYPDL